MVVGRVVATDPARTASDPPGSPTTLHVERVYKGAARSGDRLPFLHQLWMHPASPQPGDRLLLFLHRSGGALFASPCAPQTVLGERQELPLHLAWITGGWSGALQTRAGKGAAFVLIAGGIAGGYAYRSRRRRRA